MEQHQIDENAKKANAVDLWDGLWRTEGEDTWRKEALSRIYRRIIRLVPYDSDVIDLGGGIGILGDSLQKEKASRITIVDHSTEALKGAKSLGLDTVCLDLNLLGDLAIKPNCVVVGTEILEHLIQTGRDRILAATHKHSPLAFFSVPNNRLGPEEEPQHTIKFTALSFLTYLRNWYKDNVRVEVLGPYLLGICGVEKKLKLSVCMPVKDEEDDLEATLASFRGAADEMVIGVDPRSTDRSREIAEQYAEVVFELDSPEGPKDKKMPDGGVHFSHIRNQCMDRCTKDWIFMTEGHERLFTGEDTLLRLGDILPNKAQIGMVLRQGTGQQWGFPWLCINDKRFRYTRSTHNILDYPVGSYMVKLPEIRTMHERTKDKELARKEQRKVQNRKTLFEDWIVKGNEESLYYLGSEWREYDKKRAMARLEQYLQLPSKNGPMRYQARLILAKMQMQEGNLAEARTLLVGATQDDWSRVEHWVWLGDLAFDAENYEEALQFYRYAGTCCGNPPFTIWWIDLATYSYITAQRLAMCYSALGKGKEALHWARRVKDLLPDNAPRVVFEEADYNINRLSEALDGST